MKYIVLYTNAVGEPSVLSTNDRPSPAQEQIVFDKVEDAVDAIQVRAEEFEDYEDSVNFTASTKIMAIHTRYTKTERKFLEQIFYDESKHALELGDYKHTKMVGKLMKKLGIGGDTRG